MDEAALIRGLQAGDRRALEEAVGQYTHYLTAVAARAMAPAPTREDLEEVVSDTFLSLWRFRENLDPERPLRPWLAVAARNLAVSRLRGRKETQDIPDTLPDHRPGPEELAQRQALHHQLRDLVEEMSEPDRTLFLRYYYEEEPLGQVAQDLGLGLSAAKSRLARGRKRLKELLTREGGEPYAKPHP